MKAAQEIVKLRAADPVGAAIATKQFGYEPLNFEAPDKMMAQLGERVAQAESVARDWGGAPRILSKDESARLVTALNAADVDGKVGLLAQIANAVGPNGIRMVSDQLKASDKKYAVAMAGFDITPGDGGITSGEMYLRGLQLIAEKQVKDDPAVETGNVARLYATINPDNDGTQWLFKSDAARADTVELARGILAYQQWAGSGSIEDAIAAAVGGDVEAYNGKKTVMPKGIDASAIFSEDLGNLVETQAQEVKKARGTFYVSGLAMTGEELAAKMPKLALQTEKVNSDGSVTYSLMLNGESVFGDDGSLYTFDLVKTKE